MKSLITDRYGLRPWFYGTMSIFFAIHAFEAVPVWRLAISAAVAIFWAFMARKAWIGNRDARADGTSQ